MNFTREELKALKFVPIAPEHYDREDFASDQEVKWCPGCGDYAILNAFESLLPTLDVKRENICIVSGIGCSSRFTYYLNAYGMHTIHGRAPALATGVSLSRPDLAVWVVTGDGDALSIGGNHLIHALRRNVNITIMLFNNRIYGLTKGQYSPTSEQGKITKSSPVGTVETPFNAVSLALGAEAAFVARTIDSNRAHLTETLTRAVTTPGASLVEIYQNCQIFNQGAFEGLRGPESNLIELVDGEPITFGPEKSLAIVRGAGGSLEVARKADVAAADIIVHDSHRKDPSVAFELSRLTDAGVIHQAPIGVFRDVERPHFDGQVRDQITTPDDRIASLQKFITGKDTWTVKS
ncbi:MAG: 2-oxoacid:ferredoxin oxidoreductase subunit beta [Propionibacteriaceae bacterium]|jgi:2-oxoglutarate ferredoxin oxidoreductase subunit beta|nr:2-oxoacid:ferredoxin oxidoreductase subunit beta [Propionibacteriaceae bacterium]